MKQFSLLLGLLLVQMTFAQRAGTAGKFLRNEASASDINSETDDLTCSNIGQHQGSTNGIPPLMAIQRCFCVLLIVVFSQ